MMAGYFLSLTSLNTMNFVPKKSKERLNNIFIRQSSREVDSIEYILPEKYYLEHLPEPVEIHSEFGSYKNSYEFTSGKLFYNRIFEINRGTYDSEKYNDFIKFFQIRTKRQIRKKLSC